jgi:signal transduction histidine kinase/ActR/RegA family two-component response regulator
MLRLLSQAIGFVAVLVLAVGFTFQDARAAESRNLLVITSWDQHHPWTTGFVSRLVEINSERGRPLQLYVEHLDSSRAADNWTEDFSSFLNRKYRDIPIDIVVSESIPAKRFLEQATDLLPQAQRVFVASGDGDRNAASANPTSLQVPVNARYDESLEAALNIFDAKAIAVIVDTTAGGSVRLQQFLAQKDRVAPHLPVTILDGPKIGDVVKQVSALPDDTLIYYLLYFRDSDGTPVSTFAAATSISEVAPAPVFSNWEVLLGSGITGGYLMASERVAERLFYVLAPIPGEAEPPVYGHYYDWRELERHGLTNAYFPSGVDLRFRVPGYFEIHFNEFLYGSAAILMLLALAFWLSMALRKVQAANRLVEAERASLEDRVQERTADLERATEIAKAASAQKTTFLANMSHEIRTPLTGLLGLSDIIQEEAQSAPIREKARLLKSVGRHLLDVVNEILDLSKITSGNLVTESKPFRFGSLTEAVHAAFGPTCAQKGIRLILNCADADRTVIGDEFRIRQILFNLVGNAVKLTQSGDVIVDIALDTPGQDGSSSRLSIKVADSGPGIPADHLPRIFDPYNQVPGRSRVESGVDSGGTGLGLALSRELARCMGGDLGIERTDATGTVFTGHCSVEVMRGDANANSDAEAEAATSDREQQAAEQSGLSILFVDDEPLNRMLFETFMVKKGYRVTLAEDGLHALRLARSRPFDAIVMDIQMPIMDGLETLSAIRDEDLHPGRPIIALTADVIPENVERYKQAGFSECLSKPFDWSIICATIDTHASPTQDSAPAVARFSVDPDKHCV